MPGVGFEAGGWSEGKEVRALATAGIMRLELPLVSWLPVEEMRKERVPTQDMTFVFSAMTRSIEFWTARTLLQLFH